MTDCWEWTGAKQAQGYGYPSITGKHILAHRYVWELNHGPIPSGMVIRHKCDNPSCTNLLHLEIGTQSENMMDAVERGHHWNKRVSAISCRAGHPRTPENTIERTRPDRGTLERTCRVCKRLTYEKNKNML